MKQEQKEEHTHTKKNTENQCTEVLAFKKDEQETNSYSNKKKDLKLVKSEVKREHCKKKSVNFRGLSGHILQAYTLIS